jgi:hypothetical protein
VPPSFAHDGTYTVRNAGSKPHDFSVAKLKDQPLQPDVVVMDVPTCRTSTASTRPAALSPRARASAC